MSTMLPVKINDSGELTMPPCQCAPSVLGRPERAAATLSSMVPPPVERERGSYGQILKSSALVGGSQVANIVIGIVRTKAMAMLLGPSGFGLFGLYGSIQNLTQSIAGMGINSSGVRQIAEAAGSRDGSKIAKTAAVLRRTAFVLGLLGATMLLILSSQVSKLTFGNVERRASVSLLSLAVFLTLVAGGQMALIQGTRRIADLARMNVLGAFFGLCASIPLIYYFREKGVVPSLISVAVMTILTSWWYSRKVEVPVASVKLSEIWQEASALLRLGSAFMASNMMTLGVAYFVRIALLQKVGFEATGLYQSAWTLGGLYVGFILQAMGADFYPRLTASIHNRAYANRLVNEQTLIGLLLAGPGVLATLTFAPLVITLFYSATFATAVTILRWITLGVMLQVITWPMGFIIVAEGKSILFFCAELAWTVVAVGLAWACVRAFGLNGAGIAFFGSYIFHCILIYPIARRLSGFHWSRETCISAFFFLSLIAVVFCGFYVLPSVAAFIVGTIAVAVSASYSIRSIVSLVPPDRLPRQLRLLLTAVGIVRAVSSTVS